MTLVRSLAAAAACVVLIACGPGQTPTDGGSDADAASDAARQPLPPTSSGVTPEWCARAVDMTERGMLSGDTMTITGTTEMPREVMASPCNTRVTGHQLYRYRVRGDSVSLRATTAVPGGTAYLDTVLWVLEGACGAEATVVACNDDDPMHWDALGGRSTLNTRVLAAGTELVFVVGAWDGARRGAQSRGEFTLAITEVPAAAAGQMCDATRPGACMRGLDCVPRSEPAGTCAPATQEAEPNNGVMMPEAPRTVSGPLAIHGAIEPAGDTDCFAFDVPQGTTLWIEASNGEGSCRADLRADLYRATGGDAIAGDDDTGRASDVACPRIFPMDNPEVTNMAAGTYVLCVRASEPLDQPPRMTAPFYAVHVHPVQ